MPLPRFIPNHALFPLISLKISLYVIALMLPIIKNFLSYLTNWSTYSLNNENGGLVTTISDCFNNSILPALRKSPSPLKWVISF